jgi:hypothetical protein
MSNHILYNVLDKLNAIAAKDSNTDVSAAIESAKITESDFARTVKAMSRPSEDDDSGYDLDDPKHPTWAERYYEKADELRKSQRDNDIESNLDEGDDFNLQTVLANNAEAVEDYKRTGDISYELESDLHRLYYDQLSPQAQQDADDNGEIAELFAQDMDNDNALGEAKGKSPITPEDEWNEDPYDQDDPAPMVKEVDDKFPEAPEEKEPLVLSKDNKEEDFRHTTKDEDPWGLGESKVIMQSTKETDPWGLGDATPAGENGVSNIMKPYQGSKRVTEGQRTKRSQYAQLSESFDRKVARNLKEEVSAMVTTDPTGNKNVTLTANHQTSDEEANAISNILRNAGITQAVSPTAPMGMGAMSSGFDEVGDLDSMAPPEMSGDDFGADPFATELNGPADDAMGDVDTDLNGPTDDVAIAGDYENGVDDFGTDYSMSADDGLEGDNAIDVVGDTGGFGDGTEPELEEALGDEDGYASMFDYDDDDDDESVRPGWGESKTTPDEVDADRLWSVVSYWTNDNKIDPEDEAVINEIGERESGHITPQEEEMLRNIAWELFDNGIVTSAELDKGYYTNEAVSEISKLAGLKEWGNSPKGNVEDRGNYKDDVYMIKTLAGGLNKPKNHSNVNNPGDNPMNKDNPSDGGTHEKTRIMTTRQRAVNETARRLEKDLLQSFKNFK